MPLTGITGRRELYRKPAFCIRSRSYRRRGSVFLYDDFLAVTAPDGLIVDFTHEAFRCDYNGNTYQLLQSLGGNLGLLVNHDPEIIEGDTGEIYLRFETKDAVFVISAFWSIKLGDRKATLPETYCIFARSQTTSILKQSQCAQHKWCRKWCRTHLLNTANY